MYQYPNRPRHLIGDTPVLLAQAETINAHFQGYVHAGAGACSFPAHVYREAAEELKRGLSRSCFGLTYQGDGAKLIDLVRSPFEVNSIDELVLYFSRIVADWRVVILSIKNRFTASYTTAVSPLATETWR